MASSSSVHPALRHPLTNHYRYTFWVVTIVGGIGLLLATVQIVLAAAQVYYAIPAHVRDNQVAPEDV